MTSQPQNLGPGDVIAGKYRVERVLGRGGMGVVLAATHLELGELRALKLLLGGGGEDAETTGRFLREARAAARLKSEHVARVHDVGRLEDGSPYLVLEHLDGCDLGALAKARGPLPQVEAVTYLLQTLEGIAEAHAAGIIHRDLKPANLFLTTGADGTPCVKILDFGISKLAEPGASAATDMTRTDTILGSPFYMSPEQMKSTRDVDARTDIWSLGVILYRLLTGSIPFPGETITQVCAAVVADTPLPPSVRGQGVDRRIDDVVMRCLEKDPERRFPHVADLAAALAPFGPPGSDAAVERIRRTLRLAPAVPAPAWPVVPAASAVPESQLAPPSATAASWSATRRLERNAPRARWPVAVVLAFAALGAGGAGAVVWWNAGTGAPGSGGSPPAAAGTSTAAVTSGAAPPAPAEPTASAPTASVPTASASASQASSAPAPARPAAPRPPRTAPPADPFGSGRN